MPLRYSVDKSFANQTDWSVTFWCEYNHGGNVFGVSLPTTFASKTKADKVAEVLLKVMQPEFEREEREREERSHRMREELAKRPKPKPFKPTKKMPRVTACRCAECDELYREVGPPVYECSRCGQTQVEERRCEQCHIFMAKLDDESCPHCEAPLPDKREGVLVVEAPDGQLHEVEA